MMQSNRGAAQYRSVRSHGLVSDTSPTRLVQIMFEHILTNLATAQGCMERIEDNLPLSEVTQKLAAMRKAIQLIGQLNVTLDIERGGKIAQDLRALYEYMLVRLTQANAYNDTRIVSEVSNLVREIKTGWDGIVSDAR
jgi:flagellar secretion chaperone FliS